MMGEHPSCHGFSIEVVSGGDVVVVAKYKSVKVSVVTQQRCCIPVDGIKSARKQVRLDPLSFSVAVSFNPNTLRMESGIADIIRRR